jgi:hypothetical protein
VVAVDDPGYAAGNPPSQPIRSVYHQFPRGTRIVLLSLASYRSIHFHVH